MDAPIYHKLCNLKEEERIPFHMPGHKRKNIEFLPEILDMDITEIVGYDNLHQPEGIIRESMNDLKKVYGTMESWYLVNGSTVGILSAVSACCTVGDEILISRNCHKAVYHAIRLLHLKVHYFSFSVSKSYQIVERFSEEDERAMKEILNRYPKIKAIVFPSPTYEGVVMNVEKIARIGKEFKIPVIVDEAHGAHFPFHTSFPKSAIFCGADIVIQSCHKTLPAMTQTALLHLCTNQIHPEVISDKLSIYETSSPSYILMASAEYAVRYMKENVDKVEEYVDNLTVFRKKCGQLHHIHLIEKKELNCIDYDISKLLFSVKNTNINGNEFFHKLLEEFHIELEMADVESGLAMTSVCDEKKDFDALWEALCVIEKEMEGQSRKTERCFSKVQKKNKRIEEKEMIKKGKKQECWPTKVLESWECEKKAREKVSLEESVGRLAAEYIMLYPPGIPLLVPGEKIEKEMVENIRYYLYNGYNVPGAKKDGIQVIKKSNQ